MALAAEICRLELLLSLRLCLRLLRNLCFLDSFSFFFRDSAMSLLRSYSSTDLQKKFLNHECNQANSFESVWKYLMKSKVDLMSHPTSKCIWPQCVLFTEKYIVLMLRQISQSCGKNSFVLVACQNITARKNSWNYWGLWQPYNTCQAKISAQQLLYVRYVCNI